MRKTARFLQLLMGLFLIFSTDVLAGSATQVNYEITPLLGSETPKIKIVITFKGDKTGSTKIKLPDEFAGQEELYHAVKNLTVITPNAKLVDGDKAEIKIIEHVPGEEIKLEYELIQDWPGAPQAGGASGNAGGGYRPIIQKDYFHFLGSGAWLLPDLPEDAKLKVSIVWKNVQPSFILVNSFGAKQTNQTFSTNVGAFSSSVFVGGDYRVDQRMVKGKPVFMAARGKWKFTDEEFADLVEKIVSSERRFWNDYNHPYFLVTLLPIESNPNSLSIGGTGLTDSFATFITTNATLENIKFLIAHEYFHNWNTIAFGGMKEPEQLLYWFSEGFTDYYTYRLLVRTGLIDLEGYAAQYNEFLSEYYLSPVRNEDNGRVLRDFFKDYAVSKLPYRRGFLLATKWNEIIRQQSGGAKSLDDVMRDIFHAARKGKMKQLSKEYILDVLSKYAKYDFAADIEKYAEKGQTIGEFKGLLGGCIDNFDAKMGSFELGFDFDAARKDKIAAKVVKDSAAFDAGLRDGQKIVASSVYFGNKNKPVELTIEENGQRKKITYLPETKEKIDIPQFKIKANLSESDKKNCVSMF